MKQVFSISIHCGYYKEVLTLWAAVVIIINALMLQIRLKPSYILAALKLAVFLGEFGLGFGEFLL